MKATVKKIRTYTWQPLPIILSAMKMQKKTLLTAILLSHIFFSASFSQESTVFLSIYDSCHVAAPPPTFTPYAKEALITSSPRIRVAYVIPSNRTAQPNGVTYLQNAIKVGQQWYKAQMEQNNFGAKTYIFETEPDGITPLIHVVHVNVTDDFLRGDIWSRTIQAASNAGITVWASGEVWVLIPEAHLMLSDGTVTGGVALGASSGTGNSPGVTMLGSDALPFFGPSSITDDTPYDGKVLPALGPIPMKQDLSASWFEGNTFSSVASSRLGALFHEMGHAFGLGHDYRNDSNFHGNLMFNGLRGIRGSLFPEKYPQDYTRLEYASALILNVSHYFNRNKKVTSSPVISYSNPGSVVPQQGLVHITFQTSDNDSLSLAHLRYRGDVVAEMVLGDNKAEVTFAVPYFTKGDTNPYTIAVHDSQGNTSYSDVQFNVPGGYNQAPVPFIRIDPPVPGLDQSIMLNASQSQDVDHPLSAVLASWDVNNDGQFDTEPSTNKTVQYHYENPGNYLIRLKLTDPAGAQMISTPVSIKIPGEQKIAVESFTLINAGKDEAVDDLQEGAVIELTAWEGKTFSIRANTSPGMIDRVEFDLKGPITHQQIEKTPPYALFGDSPIGNFSGRKWLPGKYTLTATPFSSLGKGIALTVSFQVVEGGVAVQPMVVWDKTIGGNNRDLFSSVVPTPDGGYLLGGSSYSDASGDKSENSKGNEESDYWVVKIGAEGNKVWDKTFGGEGFDYFSNAISTYDGSYLLVGASSSNTSGDKSEDSKGGSDLWIVKIDAQGNKVWDKTFGGSSYENYLSNTIPTSNGSYLLAGSSYSDASGDKSENSKGNEESDYWVVKIGAEGNKVWDKTLGGSDHEELRSAISTSDGGYLLGGFSESNASGDKSENSKGGRDYWIVKIDTDGNKVWDKTLGGNNLDELYDIITTPDGGYLLGGTSTSNTSGDKSENSKGNRDYWVVKIDADGNKVWDKTLGGEDGEGFSNAISTPDGGYLLSGFSYSNTSGDKSENSKGLSDYWVVKIDADGNKVWDKTLGGEDGEGSSNAISTPDGGYLLGGSSGSNASGDKSENSKGLSDYWIVKLKEQNIPVISSLTLIDATTDQEIKALNDGDVISLPEVGNTLLNIRANPGDEKTNMVAFSLKGPVTYQLTEKASPYALFGDNQGDFKGKKLLPGKYTLTVTPYINDIKDIAFTVSFSVTDAAITGITLIDATLDQEVGSLSEGDVIDLSLFKGHTLSMRADTQPMQVDKVTLSLQGPIVRSRTELNVPYTLFGDKTVQGGSTDYTGLKLLPGTYTLTATPYAGGIQGNPHVITFTAIAGASVAAQVEVYPVPASGVVNILHEGKTDRSMLMLLDFNGNVLIYQPLSEMPVEQLDLSGFRKGIYYLKVVSPEGVQVIRLAIE